MVAAEKNRKLHEITPAAAALPLLGAPQTFQINQKSNFWPPATEVEIWTAANLIHWQPNRIERMKVNKIFFSSN